MEPTPAPLLDHFDELDDPRIDRTKLHSLTEILFITIAGSVAGGEVDRLRRTQSLVC